jgi:EAL domain-containing protein (putative c-di-GMP-specific phosphodiesterase class I)
MESNPACLYTINLSGASIIESSFLEFVKSQLKEYRIPPRLVCFEITETIAITHLDRATQFMQELKSMGCRFLLDDFGSGMSSFGYLKKLPVDYLKIDGLFVKDIIEDPIDRAMVKAINDIGHTMGLKTIAEFVENEDILQELNKLGVDYAQGYGISPPCPL